MRKSEIIETLLANPSYGVAIENLKQGSRNILILWTLKRFFKGKVLKELKSHFQFLREEDSLIRLGSFLTVAAANNRVAEVRKKASYFATIRIYLIPPKRVTPRKKKPSFPNLVHSKRRVVTV